MELNAPVIDAIARLQRQATTVDHQTLPGHRLLRPDNVAIEDLTDYTVVDAHGLVVAPPCRIAQHVTLQTVDSLVDYVAAFKGAPTLLFADIDKNSITAVIDYHAPAWGAEPTPAHASHTATLTLPFSLEWQLWTKIDGKLMPQLPFARFLEENAPDIAAPSAGELLDACRDLQAKRSINFVKAVRTASDNENFEYIDTTTAHSRNGGIELPSRFMLSIPVYFGRPMLSLGAFLRWTVEEGKLSLGIALNRAEQVRQAEFQQIVYDAAQRSSCPVVFGRRG